jgi:hypothetical protein
MASTNGNGSRRDCSISSADAWICGANPLLELNTVNRQTFDS